MDEWALAPKTVCRQICALSAWCCRRIQGQSLLMIWTPVGTSTLTGCWMSFLRCSRVFLYSILPGASSPIFGGGRMCLLFNGLEGDQWTIRVEVFHVSITTVGDRPVVRRGSLHSYYLGSWIDYNPVIYSVFVCDHSNKSDIEADASSGCCEDLKKHTEHAVEYIKGDYKKQKTTLPE